MKIALALLLMLSGTASAQSSPRTPSPKKPAAEKPKPVRNYDFLADKIDGDRIQPDGTTLFGLPDARRPSLIRLRGDFVREITRSAEQL